MPGSAVNELQFDLRDVERPQAYTRPRIFAQHADTVYLQRDGSFSVKWKDGTESFATPTSIAGFAVEY